MPGNDFQTDGLVIGVRPCGDNDRLITLLTAERGRITFLAKGARSLKNPNMPACNPYVFGSYVLHTKGGAHWLREAKLTESFAGIGKDIAAMYLAQYLCEVCAELSEPEEPAADLLRLTLNSLYAASAGVKPLPQIKAVFEMRAAVLAGYEPDLSACRVCGADAGDLFYLDVMNGGIVCPSCAAAAPKLPPDAPAGAVPVDEFMTRSLLLPLTPAALAALRYMISAEPKRMLAFTVEQGKDRNALSRAAESYLLSHLERGFPTLKTYYEVLR